MNKGFFITIEGIEGAGKSTVIKFIEDYLKRRSIRFIVTREPGGTEIAEEIRNVLLKHYKEKMCYDAELLLNFAGRAQHVEKVIKPALDKGRVVISDRFTDASFAYQGGGRGISEKRISVLENWVLGKLRPNLTIFLDVPVKIGLARARNRGKLDRYEIEQINFFKRVRKCYLDRAKKYKKRYEIIDSTLPLSKVQKQIISIIEKHLSKKIKWKK